jgi:hypothetical protein
MQVPQARAAFRLISKFRSIFKSLIEKNLPVTEASAVEALLIVLNPGARNS